MSESPSELEEESRYVWQDGNINILRMPDNWDDEGYEKVDDE